MWLMAPAADRTDLGHFQRGGMFWRALPQRAVSTLRTTTPALRSTHDASRLSILFIWIGVGGEGVLKTLFMPPAQNCPHLQLPDQKVLVSCWFSQPLASLPFLLSIMP